MCAELACVMMTLDGISKVGSENISELNGKADNRNSHFIEQD